jgi:hypothetical protein
LLQEGFDSKEVADFMASHFGIPAEAVRKDIADILLLWESRDFSRLIRNQETAPVNPNEMPLLEQDRQPVSERTYLLSDVPFRIRFHSEVVAAIFDLVLGHLEAPASTIPSRVFEVLVEETCYRLLLDNIEVGRETSPRALRHALVYEIAKISYPKSEWLIFLHAGAASIGKRCIVLPGLPFCGKSTLTAALVQEGFRYIAEDIVPVSLELVVAPVPARLCLREGGWRALRQEYPNVQALPGGLRWSQELRCITPSPGRENSPQKLPVHCLVFPEYIAGQACELNPISSEEVLARMIQAGAWFEDPVSEARLEELLGWIQATPGYHLRYGGLREAISSIRSLLN